MAFVVGQKVKWVTSGTLKIGEVIAIVPAGSSPASVGFPKAGGGGMPRKHESYVIRGQIVSYGKILPRKSVYWPMVSVIEAVE